jgi:hypothetical protein
MATAPASLEIEERHIKTPVPPECIDAAQTAETGFKTKWARGLISPIEWHLKENEDKQSTGNRDAYLAPVDTYTVFLLRRQLDGSFASLFINCQNRQAYVSLRGGLADITDWYGPFNF